jgi:heparan-alpha-glucosaminide N-acetyltransferase
MAFTAVGDNRVQQDSNLDPFSKKQVLNRIFIPEPAQGEVFTLNASLVLSTRYPWDILINSSDTGMAYQATVVLNEHGKYVLEPQISTADSTAGTISVAATRKGEALGGTVPILITFCVLCAVGLASNLLPCTRRLMIARGGGSSDSLRADLLNSDPILKGEQAAPTPLLGQQQQQQQQPPPPAKKWRLQSLDTFRGFALTVMMFVNYGGGGYCFFRYSR